MPAVDAECGFEYRVEASDWARAVTGPRGAGGAAAQSRKTWSAGGSAGSASGGSGEAVSSVRTFQGRVLCIPRGVERGWVAKAVRRTGGGEKAVALVDEGRGQHGVCGGR